MRDPILSTVATASIDRDMRVLLMLPVGNDALLACRVLAQAGVSSHSARSIEEICQSVREGIGVVILGEEVLTPPAIDGLARALRAQPPWSEIPVIVLMASGRREDGVRTSLEALGNATFLERPLRVLTLVQSVKVALSSRARQYDTREYLREREEAAVDRLLLLEKQRAFLRDVLHSVTEGKLSLCDDPAHLPLRGESIGDPVALTAHTLRVLRGKVLAAAQSAGFEVERAEDFVTGVSEAAMNAVVHAGGGLGSVGFLDTGTLQVWIEDKGTGIDMERLPRATLERGFSSAGTLGHGFWLLLQFCDRVYLSTGLSGTTVVLELDKEVRTPDWLA